MKLNGIPFNLDATLCCGQVFRWDKKGDWWFGVAGSKAFKVRQINAKLEFAYADEKFVANYFRLNDDLEKISDYIGKDEQIKKALKKFWGLRIVRQDPWECLVTYICATWKGIAAIKTMLLKLSQKFGEHVRLDGYHFYSFPSAEKLAKAAVKEFMQCGLGYRAKYLLATSKKIVDEDLDLVLFSKMQYEQAKKALCAFPGVGSKVADCVLLFSLGKLEAFPVDVWVKRVLLRHYRKHFPEEFFEKLSNHDSLSNTDYKQLNAFGREYFGEYAGYAQEYLYHYERMQH